MLKIGYCLVVATLQITKISAKIKKGEKGRVNRRAFYKPKSRK